VFTAAAIHVVGHHDFHMAVFSALKTEPGLAAIKMLKKQDVERVHERKHDKKKTTKLVRTETNNLKMQKGTRQNHKDKRDSIDYSPGVGFDQKNDATSKNNTGTSSNQKNSKEQACKSCGMKGHSQRTHRDCLNDVNKEKRAKNKNAATGSIAEKSAQKSSLSPNFRTSGITVRESVAGNAESVYEHSDDFLLGKDEETESDTSAESEERSLARNEITESNSVMWLADRVRKSDLMDHDDDIANCSDSSDEESEQQVMVKPFSKGAEVTSFYLKLQERLAAVSWNAIKKSMFSEIQQFFMKITRCFNIPIPSAAISVDK